MTETLAPARLMDTRTGLGGRAGALPSGGLAQLQVTGHGGVPARVGSVTLNVTTVTPSNSGWLAVTPSDPGAGKVKTSSVNFTAGHTIANAVTTAVSPTGTIDLRLSVGATAHVVVDVVAWTVAGTPTVAGSLTPQEPVRLPGQPNRRVGATGRAGRREVAVGRWRRGGTERHRRRRPAVRLRRGVRRGWRDPEHRAAHRAGVGSPGRPRGRAGWADRSGAVHRVVDVVDASRRRPGRHHRPACPHRLEPGCTSLARGRWTGFGCAAHLVPGGRRRRLRRQAAGRAHPRVAQPGSRGLEGERHHHGVHRHDGCSGSGLHLCRLREGCGRQPLGTGTHDGRRGTPDVDGRCEGQPVCRRPGRRLVPDDNVVPGRRAVRRVVALVRRGVGGHRKPATRPDQPLHLRLRGRVVPVDHVLPRRGERHRASPPGRRDPGR